MASHITVGFSHLVAIMCKRWHYKGQRSFSNIDPNKNLQYHEHLHTAFSWTDKQRQQNVNV